jgi:hypothetical protein
MLTEAGRQAGLKPHGEFFYKGSGYGRSPELGDERISYRGVRNAPTASYFGLIENGVARGKQFHIRKSIISRLIKNDGILHHLVNGDRDEALQTLAGDFRRLTWLVRLGGTAAIVFGINWLFSGFVNLLYRIPLVGSLVETGVFVVSLIVGLSLAVAVMLASFVAHHPLTVALPLAIVIMAVVGFRYYSKVARTNVRQNLERYRGGELVIGETAATATSLADRAETSFKNLAKVAQAEGGLSKKENRYLVQWGQRSGLSEPRMKALFAEAKQEGGLPQATDRADLVLLTCLAMADGVLSTKELSMLNAFGKGIGLSTHDVRKIIVQLESRTPAAA